ncbi:MAG: MarR family transcriptional regulator [Chloroflexi bacterium]|nr:MarR family transcriptional regulator [Chloroflexota bacterium]
MAMRNKKQSPELSELLLDTWWRVARFLGSEFEEPNTLDALTIGQLRILKSLSAEGPMTMSAIARAAGVAPGAATGMVDRLVARKLVKRFGNPQNRRIVQVRLTDEGQRMHTAVNKRATRRADQLTEPLAPQHREQLYEVLQALSTRVKSEPVSKDGSKSVSPPRRR